MRKAVEMACRDYKTKDQPLGWSFVPVVRTALLYFDAFTIHAKNMPVRFIYPS